MRTLVLEKSYPSTSSSPSEPEITIKNIFEGPATYQKIKLSLENVEENSANGITVNINYFLKLLLKIKYLHYINFIFKVIRYKRLYKGQKDYKVTKKMWNKLKKSKSDAIFLKLLAQQILGNDLLSCYFGKSSQKKTLSRFNEEISVLKGKLKFYIKYVNYLLISIF